MYVDMTQLTVGCTQLSGMSNIMQWSYAKLNVANMKCTKLSWSNRVASVSSM